jgi:hypothetical protein
MTTSAARRQFDEAYRRLEDQAKVDGIGSSEYERVLEEWKEIGFPVEGVEPYIAIRANVYWDGRGNEIWN